MLRDWTPLGIGKLGVDESDGRVAPGLTKSLAG